MAANEAFLELAKEAYEQSTSYFESNYRKQFEDGLRMFQSRHPQDSKYLSGNYKHRSKLFRPKTRSMIRKAESSAAIAFFSSPDFVQVDPVNTTDQIQAESSQIMKGLLQERLTKDVTWFLNVMGGLQDAMNVGLVASLQYWDYESEVVEAPMEAQMPDGTPVTVMGEQESVLRDEPCCELLPIENIKFSPAAKWYNVAETSPYLIIEMPMYVNDVEARMESGGEYQWIQHDRETILEAKVSEENTLRGSRNDDKESAEQVTSETNNFDVVQVHLNFIRVGNKDFCFYTLKDMHMLSNPVETKQMFKHCDQFRQRPVVIGFCVIETHKAIPQSPALLGKDLQTEANVVANTRLDNVLYVLNKRWVVKRGSQIDTEAIVRNVPGGVVMANNVDSDLREINWADVTSSAYAEQDRINVDYDELLGNFAQSSVMTNRKLNETVGGMRMMAQGANAVTEYTLRVFTETWLQPVLRQLMKMEQYYESDERILAIAGQKSQMFIRRGLPNVPPYMLEQELTLTVSVGMGATDPDTRFQRFMQATGAYTQLAQNAPPDLNLSEVRKELYGLAGFKDSTRFFAKPDPRFLQAQKLAQQAEDIIKKGVEEGKQKLRDREAAADSKEHTLDAKQFEIEVRGRLQDLEEQIGGAIHKAEVRDIKRDTAAQAKEKAA